MDFGYAADPFKLTFKCTMIVKPGRGLYIFGEYIKGSSINKCQKAVKEIKKLNPLNKKRCSDSTELQNNQMNLRLLRVFNIKGAKEKEPDSVESINCS